MTGIKKIVALVGIITFVLGSVTVTDAKTKPNINCKRIQKDLWL